LLVLAGHAEARPARPGFINVSNDLDGNGHVLDVVIGRSADDGAGAGDVTRYKVERRMGKAGMYERVKKIMADGSDRYNFSDTGLEAWKLYYYRVSCTNETDWSKTIVDTGVTKDKTAPGTPDVDAVDRPEDQGGVIVVTVAASPDDGAGADDVTRYEVSRRTDAGPWWYLLKIVAQDRAHYSFQDARLVNGRRYHYKVVAFDGYKYSVGVRDDATPVDNRPPRPPRNARAKDVPNDQGTALVLRFDRSGDDGGKADDVTNYRIYRRRVGGTFSRTAKIVATGATTYEYVDNGLLPGEKYIYRVRAYDGTRESDPADGNGIPIDNTAPGTPPNLSVADRPNDQGGALILIWDASADDGSGAGDVRTYELYREPNTGTPAMAHVASVAASGSASYTYTDRGLTPDQTYNYEVRASDGSKLSAAAEGSGTPTDDKAPAPPRDVIVTDVPDDNGGCVRVRFTASKNDGGGPDDVVEYTIARKKAGGAYSARKTIAATDAPAYSFADSGLEDGVTYTYGVRAADGSNYSDRAIGNGTSLDDTQPAPPTNLAVVVTPNAIGSVDITFDASVDDVAGHREVTKYEIFRRTTAGPWKSEPAIKMAATASPDYAFTNVHLKLGVEYRYKIRARGGTGVSDFTDVISVVPTDARKPAAPRNFTAADRPDDDGEAVDLAWSASPDDGAAYNNVAQYWVCRKFAGVIGDPERVKRVAASGKASYETTDTNGLQNLRAYTYTVVAVSVSGVRSNPSNEAEGIPRDNIVLAAPTNLVARDREGDSGGVIEVYWTRSVSEDEGGGPPPPPFDAGGTDGIAATTGEYELFRRASGGSWPSTPLRTISASESGAALLTEDTGLPNGKTYEYKVRYRAGTAISPFSNSDSAAARADGTSSGHLSSSGNGLTVRIVDAPTEAKVGESVMVVVSVQGSGLSSVRLLYTDAAGQWRATQAVGGAGSFETTFTVAPEGGAAMQLVAVASNGQGDAYSGNMVVALVE